MRWRPAPALAVHRGDLFPAGAPFGRRRLTVLACHRVADHHGPGFGTYRRNVSATPEEFRGQMDYVAEGGRWRVRRVPDRGGTEPC